MHAMRLTGLCVVVWWCAVVKWRPLQWRRFVCQGLAHALARLYQWQYPRALALGSFGMVLHCIGS